MYTGTNNRGPRIVRGQLFRKGIIEGEVLV